MSRSKDTSTAHSGFVVEKDADSCRTHKSDNVAVQSVRIYWRPEAPTNFRYALHVIIALDEGQWHCITLPNVTRYWFHLPSTRAHLLQHMFLYILQDTSKQHNT